MSVTKLEKPRFFKFIEEDGSAWCNWSNTKEDAEIQIKNGGIELDNDIILAKYPKEYILFSSITTSFNDSDELIYSPDPNIPSEIELKFEILRSDRSVYLNEYDTEIKILRRKLELAKTEEEKEKINQKITEWNEYANALCDITEKEGAPWLNEEIPWPVKPESI